MKSSPPQIFSAPNLLSMSRAFLVIPIIVSLHTNHLGAAIFFMLAGAVTDFLDGLLARTQQNVTSFGKILDPVSDKIAMGSLIIYLVAFQGLPWWFLAILALRDVTIAASAIYLMNAHRKAFQANLSGKISVNLNALTLLTFVLHWKPYNLYIMYIAAAVMLLSWMRYLRLHYIYLRIHLQRKSGRQEYAQ